MKQETFNVRTFSLIMGEAKLMVLQGECSIMKVLSLTRIFLQITYLADNKGNYWQ